MRALYYVFGLTIFCTSAVHAETISPLTDPHTEYTTDQITPASSTDKFTTAQMHVAWCNQQVDPPPYVSRDCQFLRLQGDTRLRYSITRTFENGNTTYQESTASFNSITTQNPYCPASHPDSHDFDGDGEIDACDDGEGCATGIKYAATYYSDTGGPANSGCTSNGQCTIAPSGTHQCSASSANCYGTFTVTGDVPEGSTCEWSFGSPTPPDPDEPPDPDPDGDGNDNPGSDPDGDSPDPEAPPNEDTDDDEPDAGTPEEQIEDNTDQLEEILQAIRDEAVANTNANENSRDIAREQMLGTSMIIASIEGVERAIYDTHPNGSTDGTGTGGGGTCDPNIEDCGDEGNCDPTQGECGDGDLPPAEDAPFEEGEEFDLTYNIGLSQQCPAFDTISVLGSDITLDYQPLCNFAISMRPMVIAAAWLLATFIISGARK